MGLLILGLLILGLLVLGLLVLGLLVLGLLVLGLLILGLLVLGLLILRLLILGLWVLRLLILRLRCGIHRRFGCLQGCAAVRAKTSGRGDIGAAIRAKHRDPSLSVVDDPMITNKKWFCKEKKQSVNAALYFVGKPKLGHKFAILDKIMKISVDFPRVLAL